MAKCGGTLGLVLDRCVLSVWRGLFGYQGYIQLSLDMSEIEMR